VASICKSSNKSAYKDNIHTSRYLDNSITAASLRPPTISADFTSHQAVIQPSASKAVGGATEWERLVRHHSIDGASSPDVDRFLDSITEESVKQNNLEPKFKIIPSQTSAFSIKNNNERDGVAFSLKSLNDDHVHKPLNNPTGVPILPPNDKLIFRVPLVASADCKYNEEMPGLVTVSQCDTSGIHTTKTVNGNPPISLAKKTIGHNDSFSVQSPAVKDKIASLSSGVTKKLDNKLILIKQQSTPAHPKLNLTDFISLYEQKPDWSRCVFKARELRSNSKENRNTKSGITCDSHSADSLETKNIVKKRKGYSPGRPEKRKYQKRKKKSETSLIQDNMKESTELDNTNLVTNVKMKAATQNLIKKNTRANSSIPSISSKVISSGPSFIRPSLAALLPPLPSDSVKDDRKTKSR